MLYTVPLLLLFCGMVLSKTKYYVVWEGREQGIFDNWAKCKAQIEAFKGAKYKSFPSLAEAEQAYAVTNYNFKQEAKSKQKNDKPRLSQSEIERMPYDIKIFSDGACKGNPGKSGTGLALYAHNEVEQLWYGLYNPEGTNNTAELNGMYAALRLARNKLAQNLSVGLFIDSSYAINCITKWAYGWQKNGWKKKGDEIKNLELIQRIFALYQELESRIAIHHVKGHAGIAGNELADRMSVLAIEESQQKLRAFEFTASTIADILAKQKIRK